MAEMRNLRAYPATGTCNFPLGINRPSPTPERLIIDFIPYTCCCFGTPDVISDDDISRIPEGVAKAGVSEADWQRHLKLIREATQEHSVSVCCQIMSYVSLFGMFYPISKTKKVNDAVRIAMENFNLEVLEKHGLYAKTQKAVFRFDKDRQEITWLSVALTPAEARILREEPHLYRYDWLGGVIVPEPDGFCCESTECCGTQIVI